MSLKGCLTLTKMKIKQIKHGIACRVGDTIYYNKSLKDYPDLLKAILEHEKKHTEGFTFQDVSLDLSNKEIKPFKKEYYKFILTNPSSLTELLPCWKYDGNLCWNPMITTLWLILLGGAWTVAFLLK